MSECPFSHDAGHIVLDDVPITGVYAIGAHSSDDQSTASVVVSCNSGQNVWVKSIDNYQINGEAVGYSQFTGFLIKGNEAGENVAFSAYKTNHALTVESGQALKFDGITTNIGQAYSNKTGLFTCPASGIYFFTFNVLSHTNSQFNGHIQLNDKPVAGVIAVGVNSSVNDQSTASAVVHCTNGQHVSVKSQDKYVLNESVGFAQFTGLLLARDGDPSISSTVSVPTVAFSAHRRHDYTAPSQAAIIFDVVETNVGQAYNEQTGKFTCPVDGTYYLTVNVLSHVNHLFRGHVVLEDREIAGVYAIGAASGSDDQSAVSVVVHCATGQQVWLKSLQDYRINGEAIGYTQFSGFLVTQDEPKSIVV